MAGTISRGIKAPIIREGDDIVKIVTDSVLAAVEQSADAEEVVCLQKSWKVLSCPVSGYCCIPE